MDKGKTVLILTGRYLPSKKDGGSIRTISNLIDVFGNDYIFKVVAHDRDFGDSIPYESIKTSCWNRIGKGYVWYSRPTEYTAKLIFEISKTVDLIYVCGCYDNYALSVLILNKIGKIDVPVIIAAMGNFSKEALKIKQLKKKLFFRISNLFGVFSNIFWLCSSSNEEADVKKVFGSKTNCFIAEDLPSRNPYLDNEVKQKTSGQLKICFFSRICKIKNLDFAIQILRNLRGDVDFTIYGNIEDQLYWKNCLTELGKLPKNVKWEYKGVVHSDEVFSTLRKEHVFLLPTFSENYGHAIYEALSAGCIVIISDNTPWNDIETEEVGWTSALSDKKRFESVIQKCIDMDNEVFNEYSVRAFKYAANKQRNPSAENQYKEMFNTVLDSRE